MSENGQEEAASRTGTPARTSRGRLCGSGPSDRASPVCPARCWPAARPWRLSRSPARCSGRCRTTAPRRRPRSSTAPIIAPRPTALPACRATMPVFRARRPSSARRCPAISVGPCSTLAARQTPSFPGARRRSRSATARAGDRGRAAQPPVRLDQYPRVASPDASARRFARCERAHRSASQPSTDATFAQNGQDRKLAFVNASVDRRTTSPDRLAAPASAFVVQAGTVIPGALITGIRSDLPGQITAQVTENVYDSPTGRVAAHSARARA